MSKNRLSQSTREKLGHYVYLLIDPRNKSKNGGVFYVGEGCGERALSHLKDKDFERKEGEKNKRISEIRKSGKEPRVDILRHGMISDEAFEVESATIDFIGKENLTNKILGHDSADRGRMSLKELEIKYKAKKAEFKDDLLLININKKFERKMSSDEIFEVTKGNWKIKIKKANKYKIVCAVFGGIVREVFEVDGWHESKEKGRRYFNGKVANEKLRERYLHKDVSDFQNQNPIRYVERGLKK